MKAFHVVSLAAALSALGCTPNYAGEYDGELTVNYAAGDKKYPTHVSVRSADGSKNNLLVELRGGSFSNCTIAVPPHNVSRSGLILQPPPPTCTMMIDGKVGPMPGGGVAFIQKDELAFFYNGASPTFSFKGARAK